jgi:hypothetical protein
MNSKNNPKKAGVKRRDFLVNLPLAAAALTLNSAFGFPVSSEQGGGKLFLKMTDVNGTKNSDGSFQFSVTDLENLKSGKMESLAIKWDISFDQRRWQSLNTTITDKYFMKQLTEIAQKA